MAGGGCIFFPGALFKNGRSRTKSRSPRTSLKLLSFIFMCVNRTMAGIYCHGDHLSGADRGMCATPSSVKLIPIQSHKCFRVIIFFHLWYSSDERFDKWSNISDSGVKHFFKLIFFLSRPWTVNHPLHVDNLSLCTDRKSSQMLFLPYVVQKRT